MTASVPTVDEFTVAPTTDPVSSASSSSSSSSSSPMESASFDIELLVPHLCLALALVALMLLSFLHYHHRRRRTLLEQEEGRMRYVVSARMLCTLGSVSVQLQRAEPDFHQLREGWVAETGTDCVSVDRAYAEQQYAMGGTYDSVQQTTEDAAAAEDLDSDLFQVAPESHRDSERRRPGSGHSFHTVEFEFDSPQLQQPDVGPVSFATDRHRDRERRSQRFWDRSFSTGALPVGGARGQQRILSIAHGQFPSTSSSTSPMPVVEHGWSELEENAFC